MLMSSTVVVAWHHHLEARKDGDAADGVQRLRVRLEGAMDDVAAVLRTLTGSPAYDLEEGLRVCRTTLSSTIEELRVLERDLRFGGSVE
jgi:hypothetical protein